MSETDASDTSETSSTSSVGTQTRLHTDLSSYNSDEGYVAHVVLCAPTVPHAPVENRSVFSLPFFSLFFHSFFRFSFLLFSQRRTLHTKQCAV